jgi:hypothetical protein
MDLIPTIKPIACNTLTPDSAASLDSVFGNGCDASQLLRSIGHDRSALLLAAAMDDQCLDVRLRRRGADRAPRVVWRLIKERPACPPATPWPAEYGLPTAYTHTKASRSARPALQP